MNLWGLAFNFLGSILVGVAGVKGLVTGFGGPIVWKGTMWRVAWHAGWALLAAGFAL